jgi:hypothetical protein
MTEYKNRILFLRKSKEGKHVFAFNRDGILGEGVKSILINVSDLEQLIGGGSEWCKVSAMEDLDADKTESG